MYLFNDDGCLHSDISDNPNISVLRQKSSMQWFTLSWSIFQMLRGSWSTECCLRKRRLFWHFVPVIRYCGPGLFNNPEIVSYEFHVMVFVMCRSRWVPWTLSRWRWRAFTNWVRRYCPPAIQTRSSPSNPGSASQRLAMKRWVELDDDY